MEGIQRCLEEAALPDAEFQDKHTDATSSRAEPPVDHPSDETRDADVDLEAEQSEESSTVLEEFRIEVYDELDAVKKEIEELRHDLEFTPYGHNAHAKPIDQFGHVIQKNSRQPYSSPEEWKEMEIGRRKKATATFAAKRSILDSKGDRAASLPVPWASAWDRSRRRSSNGVA